MLYDGDTFTQNGREFRVTFPYDDAGDTPWDRECGHGEVSDWTTRGKRPGERVLSTDRHQSCRFYDFQGAVATARRDGWSFGNLTLAERAAGLTIEEAHAKLTKRQKAARAMKAEIRDLCPK